MNDRDRNGDSARVTRLIIGRQRVEMTAVWANARAMKSGKVGNVSRKNMTNKSAMWDNSLIPFGPAIDSIRRKGVYPKRGRSLEEK